MSELSRRTLLAGTAGLLGLSSVGARIPAAHAEAPPARKQVPSAYRYRVGDVEVTVIADGMRSFPLPDTFVRNQPKDAVKAALRSAFLNEERLSMPFNVVLLNIGGRLVLVDTGNGGEPGAVGLLPGTLAALGIPPEKVDQVVISHFHGDHINGLLRPDGTPTYPNAQLMVPEKEWAFWMDDGEMSRAPDGLKSSFQNARRVFTPFGAKVERYAWDKEVAPGLTAMATPGHTPGHTSFHLDSAFEELIIQSDLTNLPALFVAHPDWQVQFDMDGAQAAEVRRKTLDRIAADRIKVAGYHFPFPAVAHVDKVEGGYRYVPVVWDPVL